MSAKSLSLKTGDCTQLLKKIIADQQEEEVIPSDYHHRTAEKALEALIKNKEITVITGIRRCGKSVLMNRIRMKAERVITDHSLS